tara:strand:+ start:519 stop:1085 length:567 start_codon:yes stop_codon:yes gene_type:complete
MTNQKIEATGLVELPIESLESPEMLELLNTWAVWCAARPAPAWQDVNLLEMPKVLSKMSAVAYVLDGGEDFVYRYWGPGVTLLFGRDETGTRISDHPVLASRVVRIAQLKAVIEDCCPKLFLTTIRKKDVGTVVKKLNLRFPIMDNPGEVTKKLSVCVTEPAGMEDYDDLTWFWTEDPMETSAPLTNE